MQTRPSNGRASGTYRSWRLVGVATVLVVSACSGSDSEPSPTDQSPATTAESGVATTQSTTTQSVDTTSTSPDPEVASTVVDAAPTTEAPPTSTDASPGDTDPDRPFVINGPATVDPDDETGDAPTTDPVVTASDD